MNRQRAGRTIEVRIACAAFALLCCCFLAWLIRVSGNGGLWYALVWLFAAKWALILVFDLPDPRGFR